MAWFISDLLDIGGSVKYFGVFVERKIVSVWGTSGEEEQKIKRRCPRTVTDIPLSRGFSAGISMVASLALLSRPCEAHCSFLPAFSLGFGAFGSSVLNGSL